MLNSHRPPRGLGSRRSRSRGLSIVEFMVGVTIGLFLIGGATAMLVNSTISSRALLAEARLNQDLRMAADLITRDLRRASYWENSIAGTTTAAAATTANPHGTISVAGSTISYSMARDASSGRTGTSDLNTNSTDEQFGFRVSSGRIHMQVGYNDPLTPNWQPLTDSNVMTVTGLTIVPTQTALDIRAACAQTCCDEVSGACTAVNVPLPAGCPKITVRRYDLVLTAQSASDSAVARTLRSSVRVRNDISSGACPL